MYYIGDDVFPYAVYHSVYDTYQWLTRFVDPDFSYHMTTTQVAARSLMLTADSIVLPFDVRHYPKSLRRSLRELNDTYGKDLYQSNVTLDYIDTAISRLALACGLPNNFTFLYKLTVQILSNLIDMQGIPLYENVCVYSIIMSRD